MAELRMSIIIPTHGRVAALTRVLSDLAAQTVAPGTFEVIVADDGSLEDPQPALQALTLPYPMRLLRLPKAGPAAARNRALKVCGGDLILFLNDDARPLPQCVAEHIRALEAQTQPTAILGAFSFPETLRVDLFQRLLEDGGYTITTRLFQGGAVFGYQCFWTGNLSIPRVYVDQVGGFDESYPEPSHEDIELGYRLEKQLGVRVLYVPDAACGHEHAMTLAGWRKQKRMGGRNAWRMHRQHRVLSLGSLEVDGEPARVQLEALWESYQRQQETLSWLEQLVAQYSQTTVFTRQELRMNGRIFRLPADRDMFIREVIALLDEQEQLVGIAQAALGLPQY